MKRMVQTPISDCEVRDPRIRRTRQLLQGALQSLLLTRSFEEISVQEIAEAATVNRATFYDHYTDKFALLDALIAGGFHKVLHERDVRYDAGCPTQANTIIAAVCDYLLEIHANGACAKHSPFEPLVDAAIIGAIRRVLTRNLRGVENSAALTTEMAVTAASAAIYGAAREWQRNPDRPSAAVITPQILAMVLPILQAVPKGNTCSSESASDPASAFALPNS
jgi:AcrR family transcriptional regulator